MPASSSLRVTGSRCKSAKPCTCSSLTPAPSNSAFNSGKGSGADAQPVRHQLDGRVQSGAGTAEIQRCVYAIACNRVHCAHEIVAILEWNRAERTKIIVIAFASSVVFIIMALNFGFESAKKKKEMAVTAGDNKSAPSFAVPSLPMEVSTINVSKSMGGDRG